VVERSDRSLDLGPGFLFLIQFWMYCFDVVRCFVVFVIFFVSRFFLFSLSFFLSLLFLLSFSLFLFLPFLFFLSSSFSSLLSFFFSLFFLLLFPLFAHRLLVGPWIFRLFGFVNFSNGAKVV